MFAVEVRNETSSQAELNSSKSSEGLAVLFGKTRYLILALSCLCLTFSYSNSLAFNFTVICMDDVTSQNNGTGDADWLHSPSHVNSLFSAIAIGCLVGTIPLTFIVHHIGIGGAVSLYGCSSAIATLLFPIAVKIGYPAVFVARIIQGIPTSLSYPATGLIASQWSTSKGAGSFIAILSTHIQFCSIFTMSVSGALCESSWGWRSVYYLQGIISLTSHLIFYIFYHDDPNMHKTVGELEQMRMRRGRENQSSSKKVPYRAICTDPCVIGVWLSTIGATLGFQVFLLYGPTYMNKVLGYDVSSTGLVTALPYILSAMVKFSLGPISDRLTCISDRMRMICFAAFSQGAMAVCFAVVAQANSASLAQAAYTGAIMFSGVNAVGTIKCATLVFRQHVHFVMSVVSFFLCMIVLLVPVAVTFICPNNTPEEWSNLFMGVSVIVVAASTPFIFVARDQPAAWTKNKVQPEKSFK